jgi:hypothetical protein
MGVAVNGAAVQRWAMDAGTFIFSPDMTLNALSVRGSRTGQGLNAFSDGGVAVYAQGGDVYAGVEGVGGATDGVGVRGFGGGTGAGGYFVNGTAATGGTRRSALVLGNGDLTFFGVTNPTSTSAISNTITPMSFPKAWGKLDTGGGSVAVDNGQALNVASVSCPGAGIVRVTLASAMANDDYAVIANSSSSRVLGANPISTTVFEIDAQDHAAGAVDLCAGAYTISFVVYGAQ